MRKLLAIQIAFLLGTAPIVLFAQTATTASAQAIAPMPLSQALDLLAQRSGLQIVYHADVAMSVNSHGAAANPSPEQQLRQLLKGTGLTYRYITPTSVSIEPQPRSSHAASDTQGATSPGAAKGMNAGALELAPISVQANPVNTLAPSSPPLDATQPTSVIDERFIRDGLRLNANFDDIIKYAPSVTVTSPEGPGLGKNEDISIRGFQDGQFNITFDGIPFGDTSNLHHTTSAYFNNHVLGQVEIDRGPGNASTIGNATFGGTVGLRSRDPSDVPGVTVYATVGSWNTYSGGVSAEGQITANTRAFADVSKESSDTFLKGTDDDREHVFLKTITDLGSHTTLTFVTSYNQEHQNTVQGATKQEIAEYGWRYGLTNDPTLQSYTGYNAAAYYSSFNYLGLTTQLGDWNLDNKIYYNSFDHFSNKTTDATDDNPADNGVTLYNAKGKKVATYPDDVPGKVADGDFHSFGDVLRIGRDLGPGQLLFGLWFDRSIDDRYQYPIDMTTGDVIGTKYGHLDNYLFDDRTDTVQPYVQYDWNITDQLTLSPGVRYSQVTRDLNATINDGTNVPLDASATYSAALPSLTLHDQISDQWAAYAQAAKGFLAPPIDVIELNGSSTLKPELTTNYQLGTTYAASNFTFGADVYYIDFNNYLVDTEVNTDEGEQELYVNGGGAIYRGAEVEGTLALTHSLSLYANASYNEARYKQSTVQIADTPRYTAAMGILYSDSHGFFGSLMGKFVGTQYGVDNTTDDAGNTVFQDSSRIGGYFYVDAALGYRSEHGGFAGKGWSLSADINNLFNVHKITAYAGTQSVSGAPLYFGLPGRGVFIDMSMKF